MSSVTLNPYTAPRIIVSCAGCRARYQVSSTMCGKTARCSKCQTDMRIPSESAVSPTAVAGQRSKKEQLVISAIPGMRTTGLGLLMSAWGSTIAMALIATIFTFSFTSPFVLENCFPYLGGGVLACGLLAVIGVFVCGSVSRESGAKGWIKTTIILCGVNMVIAAYVAFCIVGQVAPVLPPAALNLATTLLGTICFFTFLTFIKKVAEYTRRPELATTAKVIMWIQVAILAASVGMVVLSITMKAGELAALLINGLAIVIAITTLINQVILAVLEFQLGTHLRRA